MTHQHRTRPRLAIVRPAGVCAIALYAACSGDSNPAPAGPDRLTLPIVSDVEAQPLRVLVGRLRDALDYVGQPMPRRDTDTLDALFAGPDGPDVVREIQSVLDPYCLVGVHINPEARVKVQPGPAPRQLVEKGWRAFLVKVHNEAGVTARLAPSSPQALPLWGSPAEDVEKRWLTIISFDLRPLEPRLSGLALEYRIVLLHSRDAGQRAAVLAFDVGQGTQDLGFRNDTTLLFECAPTAPITLRVRDEHGVPTTAGFEIRDALGRLYPEPHKRLAPDFVFHPQVYRKDGDVVKLPPGSYWARCTRGPEYETALRQITVDGDARSLEFELQRWIDPSVYGWWSGDHHIHAAGCGHYFEPTEGVHPGDMVVHCQGEDLKIGCALTWGPCFDYQKQFFSGSVDAASVYPHLLRYDIEVSGFGSHVSGHLALLRLNEQVYPGGTSTAHWPTLGLNVLRWAKRQDAICGYTHSGSGLEVDQTVVPNWRIPPFDGIGANEYIVNVTHELPGPDGRDVPAVDFISTCDTPAPFELNIWYHVLNCGFRTRIAGETDFPCLSGDRVGGGRSYVKLDGLLDYDLWCDGIRRGRSYVSDGSSHLIDFTVAGVEVGTGEGGSSEVRLAGPGDVAVTALVAARITERPDPGFPRGVLAKPYWHAEKARIGDSRDVQVQLIVNGQAVAREVVRADGVLRPLRFDVRVERSSWIALRIYPASHTNPVFVLVDDAPIRASRRSAQWCLDSVDACWTQKLFSIAPDEIDDATSAYQHAREVYRQILAESPVD